MSGADLTPIITWIFGAVLGLLIGFYIGMNLRKLRVNRRIEGND